MKNNWPTKKLREIAATYSGTWGPADSAGTPVLRSTNFNSNGTISWDEVAYRSIPSNKVNQLTLSQGDILIEKSGGSPAQPVGRVVYFDQDRNEKVVYGNFISKLQVKGDETVSKFLFYYLLYFYKTGNINRYQSQTTGIRNLQLSDYLGIDIPKINSSIQNEIVERLDAIGKAQALCDAQISKIEELFSSLIIEELKYLETDIVRLGEICDFQYGYTQSASDKGKYRFIRITDIDDCGEIRSDDTKFLSDSKDLLRPYILKRGDLLVARTGATYGKILYFDLDRPSVFASYLIRIIPNSSKVLSKFIWLFSRSAPYWEQARRLVSGSGQPQFNANKVREVKIKIPNIKDQQKIVKKLETVQEYKKLLLKQKSLLKELFDSVLYRSMNGEMDQ